MRANKSAPSKPDGGQQAFAPKCTKLGCELLVHWVSKDPTTTRKRAAIEQLCPDCSPLFANFVNNENHTSAG